MKAKFTFLVLAIAISQLNSQVFESTNFDNEPINSGLLVDLNDDGIVEIIGKSSNQFTSQGLYIWQILNQSDLSLEKQEVLPPDQDYFSKIKNGDIDKDGDQDIILSVGPNRTPNLIINNSNTQNLSFETIALVDFGSGTDYEILDMDNDGIMDIIILKRFENKVDLLKGNGNNNFTEITNNQLFDNPTLVRQTDLDGDQINEVLIADENGIHLIKYINGGLTTTTISTDIVEAVDFQIADMNNDGQLDIVAASDNFFSNNNVGALINDGSDSDWASTNITNSIEPSAILVVDINNDGNNDVLVGNRDENSYIYISTGGSNPSYSQSEFVGFNGISAIHPGDLDGDGDDDYLLIIPGQFSSIYTINNNPLLNIFDIELSNNVVLYPQPSKEYIMFDQMESPISNLKIYSSNGQLKLKLKGTYENGDPINIQQLSDGIHFLLGDINGNLIRKKIIINNNN